MFALPSALKRALGRAVRRSRNAAGVRVTERRKMHAGGDGAEHQ